MNKNWFCGLCATLALVTTAIAQTPRYKVGRVATTDEIRKRDISVAPDGSGLPTGHGTVARVSTLMIHFARLVMAIEGKGLGRIPLSLAGRARLPPKTRC